MPKPRGRRPRPDGPENDNSPKSKPHPNLDEGAAQPSEGPDEGTLLSVASEYHDRWREPRRLSDGSFEPRWKTTTDAQWIEEHGTDQVDIANVSFTDLPQDWQAENKAAAEVVVDLLGRYGSSIDISDPQARNAVGGEIHDAWLSRNSWARSGELDVPFADLSPEEQAKDLRQMEIALNLLGGNVSMARGGGI